jgi:hypothetical protein
MTVREFPTPEQRASQPADTGAAFAELVCADTELLRVEFDEIIAANFPPGDGRRFRCPPRRPRSLVTDQPRAAPARRSTVVGGPGGTRYGAAAHHQARQRSPPHTRAGSRFHGPRKEVSDRAIPRPTRVVAPRLVTAIDHDELGGLCRASPRHEHASPAPARRIHR